MFEFDLADRVDDLICTFEGGSDSDMDWISMIITGWIVFMLSSFVGVKFIYRKLTKSGSGTESIVQPVNGSDTANTKPVESVSDKGSTANGRVTKAPSSSEQFSKPKLTVAPLVGISKCTGPDPEVVEYVTDCHDWFLGQLQEGRELQEVKDSFVDALNKILRGNRKEDSTCMTVVDLFQAGELTLMNLFAEQQKLDTIKSTCDCETSLRGILSLYSTDIGSRTCDIFVDRLSGRLKILFNVKTEIGVVSFDGWPEICLGVVPSKDTTRLEPKLAELVTEKLSAAIREAEVEIDFKQFLNFPNPPSLIKPQQHEPNRDIKYPVPPTRKHHASNLSPSGNQAASRSSNNSDGNQLTTAKCYYDFSSSEASSPEPYPFMPYNRNSAQPTNTSPTPGTVMGQEGQYGEERGRRRTRRGDIFTSIRRRFSKTRSKSAMLADDAAEGGPQDPRSISEVRQTPFVRELGGVGMSSRSSASSLSGFSGHSTSTFFHESSTLVIECIENNVKKYFLVPPSMAETGRWKKRGKKLHIYNDHTFVAKRIASGVPCSVCFGRFQFSLGKQGYACRDCRLKCHKECHIRVPGYCGNTSVYDIDLEHLPLE